MNEYLNTLLEQIRCKKVRPYIRQELQDHIENQIEENIHAGMDYESAEKEAVKDMGDPIQTGISLDRIHKPQIAWKLLFMITLLSVVGIITHIMITRHIDVAEASISGKYVIHVIVGIAVMMGLYFVDYTLLAKVSKLIAVILIGVCLWTLFFGVSLNGKIYWIVIGRWSVSMPALMLFYIPIYGGVLYKYYGSGYSGLIKAAVWMVIPVLLVLQMPATMSAGLMLMTMLVMLTIAIQKEWFAVNKKKAIVALWGIFMVLPVISFIGMYFGNLESNKFIGSNSTGISRTLPSFNGLYINLFVIYIRNDCSHPSMLYFNCHDIFYIWNSFETEESIRHDDGVWMWYDFFCKLYYKHIKKFRSASTNRDILPVFIGRWKLYYCFIWADRYHIKHI